MSNSSFKVNPLKLYTIFFFVWVTFFSDEHVSRKTILPGKCFNIPPVEFMLRHNIWRVLLNYIFFRGLEKRFHTHASIHFVDVTLYRCQICHSGKKTPNFHKRWAKSMLIQLEKTFLLLATNWFLILIHVFTLEVSPWFKPASFVRPTLINSCHYFAVQLILLVHHLQNSLSQSHPLQQCWHLENSWLT